MSLQSIKVKRTYIKTIPPPTHTVYEIELKTPLKQWSIQKRYSDFDKLNKDLITNTKLNPPCNLPPKHLLAFRRGTEDEIIKERSKGFEVYLRSIYSNKNSVWRDSKEFKNFLELNKVNMNLNSFNNWLEDLNSLNEDLSVVRSLINKRDNKDNQDVKLINLEAKKILLKSIKNLNNLTRLLDELNVSKGEFNRRQCLLLQVQDQIESLHQLITTSQFNVKRNLSNHSLRTDLVSKNNSGSSNNSAHRRVIGKQPTTSHQKSETNATIHLNDEQLLNLHKSEMDKQDEQLTNLSNLLSKQKSLGLILNDELNQQNESLDNLNDDLSQFEIKLSKANNKFNQL